MNYDKDIISCTYTFLRHEIACGVESRAKEQDEPNNRQRLLHGHDMGKTKLSYTINVRIQVRKIAYSDRKAIEEDCDAVKAERTEPNQR